MFERGSPDDGYINLDDGDEVRHWSHKLNTTPERLKEAVIAAGTSPASVKRFLEMNLVHERTSTPPAARLAQL